MQTDYWRANVILCDQDVETYTSEMQPSFVKQDKCLTKAGYFLKNRHHMILNWCLTSLSFCDLPGTFWYRNRDETRYKTMKPLISFKLYPFSMKKRKPREPNGKTAQMWKPISGQCSLSLPRESDRKPLIFHCFLGVSNRKLA